MHNLQLQAPYVGLLQRGTAKHYPVFCGAKSWLEQALGVIHGDLVQDGNSSAASWLQDLQQSLPRNSPDPDGTALAHFATAGFGVNAARQAFFSMLYGCRPYFLLSIGVRNARRLSPILQ